MENWLLNLVGYVNILWGLSILSQSLMQALYQAEVKLTKTDWGSIKEVGLIGGLFLCLATLCFIICICSLSCLCLVISWSLFILWCKRLKIIREQLCRTLVPLVRLNTYFSSSRVQRHPFYSHCKKVKKYHRPHFI